MALKIITLLEKLDIIANTSHAMTFITVVFRSKEKTLTQFVGDFINNEIPIILQQNQHKEYEVIKIKKTLALYK